MNFCGWLSIIITIYSMVIWIWIWAKLFYIIDIDMHPLLCRDQRCCGEIPSYLKLASIDLLGWQNLGLEQIRINISLSQRINIFQINVNFGLLPPFPQAIFPKTTHGVNFHAL